MAAVADLIDAEPLQLSRRGYSLSAVEVPGGSWTVGKMHSNRPAEKTSEHSTQHGTNRASDHSTHGGSRVSLSDHGNRRVSLDVARRRNSLSMVGHDAAAVRSSLRAGPVNIHAFAGMVGASEASLPLSSMHPAIQFFTPSFMHALLRALPICLLCVCHVLHVSASNGYRTIILFYTRKQLKKITSVITETFEAQHLASHLMGLLYIP